MDGTVARADMNVRYLGLLEKDMEEVLRHRLWEERDGPREVLRGVLRFAADQDERLVEDFFLGEAGVLVLLAHLCNQRPGATASFPETKFFIDQKPTLSSTYLQLAEHEKEVKFYIGLDFRFIRTSSPISEHAAMQHAFLRILQLYLMFVRIHRVRDIDETERSRRVRIQEETEKLERDAFEYAISEIENRFRRYVGDRPPGQ